MLLFDTSGVGAVGIPTKLGLIKRAYSEINPSVEGATGSMGTPVIFCEEIFSSPFDVVVNVRLLKPLIIYFINKIIYKKLLIKCNFIHQSNI